MNGNQAKDRRNLLKQTQWGILWPRLALGMLFVFAGVNAMYNLLPEDTATAGYSFFGSMAQGGLYTVINIVFIIAGVLLLFNFAGQAGVILLVPPCLVALGFHSLLRPEGTHIDWICLALEALLMIVCRKNFLAIFKKDGQDPLDVKHRHRENKDKSDVSDFVLHN